MSRIVIAVDSFKGSITAAQASAAVAAGWRDARPSDEIVVRPMADGGEGTLESFASAVTGAQRMPVVVRGPHGRAVEAAWLLLPDGTGVVELASTSGIELLGADLRPWDADTFGFGEAVGAALDHGVRRLVLGIGSSSSTDAGVGLLTALGAVVTDADGAPSAPGLRGVDAAAMIDLGGLRALPPEGAIVLSDVTNPLSGPRGAAHVFGPQKGLTAAELDLADRALARFAALTGGWADPLGPGTGAAGGTGFALALWGARLASGATEVARLIGLDDALAGAQMVITGEGAYDGQSAAGKVPAFVAERGRAAGAEAVLVAGRIATEADTSAFAATVSLSRLAGSGTASLADPIRWLRLAGAALASRPEVARHAPRA
ncbi:MULTISPECIES: glycerate kinase [unclassified Microbacterium]|uniref:glycerate kinase n=1 Tax=unclassified Microbacterium TaxID=2609290 RepID=UPI003018F591